MPPEYCPRGLAIQWCADNPSDATCADIVVERPACMFLEVDNNPCSVPACAESVLTEECLPYVEAHCEAHPDDIECALYRLGDCLFLPGSPPCEAPLCSVLEDVYDSLTCDTIIDEYCRSLLQDGKVDPECSFRGYSPSPLTVVPDNMESTDDCPWPSIELQCKHEPTSAGCIQMQLNGIMSRKLSPQMLPLASTLDPQIQTEREVAYAQFVERGLVMDADRRQEVMMAALCHLMFDTGDVNQDGVISVQEFAFVVNYAASIIRLDRHLSSTTSTSALHAMLDTAANGEFVTFSDFEKIVHNFFVIG
eukprot:CAMPEP_0197862912 /NCGR_PEP_ID=MMETSP1438-20131217/40014_1 /TAXON_ID=1461541 /ORGANISM="Pterosperma sp., Strain CCMP1384" /LENGTH=306 /DNA_ID=CAMNT_0043480629 /DNA_START=78 /DNA_END=998 /DNA_ORIENTATION=+